MQPRPRAAQQLRRAERRPQSRPIEAGRDSHRIIPTRRCRRSTLPGATLA